MAMRLLSWSGLLWFGLFFSLSAQARMATAPNSADQRLINPAAGALRESFGFAVDASHQEDKENVLGLDEGSTISVNTKIDTANSNLAFRTGTYFWELSVSPQAGNKDTLSRAQTASGPTHKDSNAKLNITPVQAIVATSYSTGISIGLKLLATSYSFTDAVDLNIEAELSSEQISETKILSGTILVAAPGIIYQLGNSGFSIAYVAELIHFKNDQNIKGTNRRLALGAGYTGVYENTSVDTQSSDTILARKDVVGIGYNIKFAGGNGLRFDLSYEKMPPLTKVQGYPRGQLIRAIAEANFLWFRIGVEATERTGYYVDTYNLIPYFFKVDHLGTDKVSEVGFFGGLKTSKGHGFGASFSKSTSVAPQRLTAGSLEQEVEKTSLTYGASYSYFF